MDKIYYLDNAATTKIFDEEFDLMKEENQNFYNPSAAYMPALKSKKKLNEARECIVKLLGGQNGKLLFTSSATESNNTVFEGVHLRKGQIVLISAGEHPSVYNSALRIKEKGIDVKEIPLLSNGRINFDKFKEMMNENVGLVSVIHVSNETGAINDIKKICSYAKSIQPTVIVHSDGVQAFGKIQVNLRELGVDLYTISAHKIFAPRGIAGLWIKKGVCVNPLLVGGGQEEGLRSSTENVAGAIAFKYAAEKVHKDFEKNYNFVQNLKNKLIFKLKNSKIADFICVNSCDDFSPYILSLTFKNIKGEVLIHSLEADGIYISTGSACSAKKAGNRILAAMGMQINDVIGSVRISFSPYMDYDLDYICLCIEKNVLRFEKNVLG